MVLPSTLGELRQWAAARRVPRRLVKDELRENLIRRLREGGPLFPGIIGYEDTVIPQVINAILSKHNFILLGLRGQAKTRLLRALTTLLDEHLPAIAGCEIHDDPFAPICAACRDRAGREGDSLRLTWLTRDRRYVEKLATPDVTIADMIGDLDPIKAARGGLDLADESTMHYGLIPRANRGIFAINELPDLAGKVQVGLFNILQEGDIQIKGYPVRLPLDVLLVFSANPEDYTARGKIITPLKDRIGSEIRTHYPASRHDALAITSQEAWTDRRGAAHGATALPADVPLFVREIIEELAFQARTDPRVDRRSGVSQRLPITCLENAISNAERRALASAESPVVPRVTDVYAALPSLTGKIELEYEGELKGAETVGREIIRAAVATVFNGRATDVDLRPVIEWFERGGTLDLSDATSSADLVRIAREVTGLDGVLRALGVDPGRETAPHRAAAIDFVLEGLAALKKISRSDEGRLFAPPSERKAPRDRDRDRAVDAMMEDDEAPARGKKKYYN